MEAAVTAKQKIVTDRLRAYSAAMKEIGDADRHEVGDHNKLRRSMALAEWRALVA